MVAKKRVKKQTMREFRAWLEGVEELQPADWSPNKDQWLLIRAKIDGIKEEVVEKPTINNNSSPAYASYAGNQTQHIPGIQPPPVAQGVPAGKVTVTPTANPLFSPSAGQTKTPDIDTSDGNVSSSFE